MASNFDDDTSGQNYSTTEARNALAGIADDGARLAERVVTPAWYHPALGLIIAVLVGSQALPGAYPLFAVVPALIAIPILRTAYSSRYGVMLTEAAGPRTRRLMIGIVTIMVLAMVAALVIKMTGVALWWVLVPTLIAFVSTVVLGRRYDAVLRQEIAANARGRR